MDIDEHSQKGYHESVEAVLDAVDAYLAADEPDPSLRDKIVGAALELRGYVRSARATRNEPDAECEPFKAALCPHDEGRCLDCCEQCEDERVDGIAEVRANGY